MWIVSPECTGPLPHASSGGNAPKRKKSVSGAAATPGKPPALPEPTFKCEICECDFNNEIPYQAHMVSLWTCVII